MQINTARQLCLCVSTLVLLQSTALTSATAEDKKPDSIVLAEGKIQLDVPDGWQSKKPRNRIVEFEFAIPAIEGDDVDGRVTVMGAGGSIDANVSRWIAQFVQPDRTATSKRTRREEIEVAGQQIHLVDITGDFKDRPRGPLGPTIMREKYRMLGAIIVTDKLGQYFVKATGPRRTIAKNEEAFKKLVESLKVSKK